MSVKDVNLAKKYNMIKAYKLYTGTDGNSHVQKGRIAEEQITEAESIRFQESPPYTFYDWHNAPSEQYVITLSGTLEFTTQTGETFILRPGEILIAMDITGTAHKWRLIDDEPWRRAYVVFKTGTAINFVSD
jgi:quercetin dioxygenase-like cupin family protein